MPNNVPSKAQAYRLAELWASSHRSVEITVEAPAGRTPYNDLTVMALKRRGWIAPDGYGPQSSLPPYTEGYKYETFILTWDGIVALHRFLSREIEASRETDSDA